MIVLAIPSLNCGAVCRMCCLLKLFMTRITHGKVKEDFQNVEECQMVLSPKEMSLKFPGFFEYLDHDITSHLKSMSSTHIIREVFMSWLQAWPKGSDLPLIPIRREGKEINAIFFMKHISHTHVIPEKTLQALHTKILPPLFNMHWTNKTIIDITRSVSSNDSHVMVKVMSSPVVDATRFSYLKKILVSTLGRENTVGMACTNCQQQFPP